MALTAKQLQRIKNVQNMIDNSFQRLLVRPNSRPDSMIFHKLEKYIRVWAQNAQSKAVLDSELELQTLLYNVTMIARTPWDIRGLLKPITTEYQLEQCQLQIVKGVLDHQKYANYKHDVMLNQSELLPMVYSYYQMVK